MANVLDFVEPGPLLSDVVVKPPIVSKATVQRCISKLSPHWDDEQLEAVVSMFKAHGLLEAEWSKESQQTLSAQKKFDISFLACRS